MKRPLLSIPNYHAANCGEPPALSWSDGIYVGYFENEHGEQWVFALDRESANGKLYGGDIGWTQPVEIAPGLPITIVLNEPEGAWLKSCWKAATTGEVAEFDIRILRILVPLLPDQTPPQLSELAGEQT